MHPLKISKTRVSEFSTVNIGAVLVSILLRSFLHIWKQHLVLKPINVNKYIIRVLLHID